MNPDNLQPVDPSLQPQVQAPLSTFSPNPVPPSDIYASGNSTGSNPVKKIMLIIILLITAVLIVIGYFAYTRLMPLSLEEQKITLSNKNISVLVPKDFTLVPTDGSKYETYNYNKGIGVAVGVIKRTSSKDFTCEDMKYQKFTEVFNASLNKTIDICFHTTQEQGVELFSYTAPSLNDADNVYMLDVLSAKNPLDSNTQTKLKEIFESFSVN